uniref:PLAT domain-containing protein n=1 Tax=Eptatretus burgeri TaxID=7764 RepID=A0A8C4PZX4_EPTBU
MWRIERNGDGWSAVATPNGSKSKEEEEDSIGCVDGCAVVVVLHHVVAILEKISGKYQIVDVFIVPSLSLGNFKNVTIWHDGSGYFPTWFLKNIRIVETFAGMEPTFTYSCWIKGNDPKTLYLQIPGSCHSLDEREPKRPNDKFSMGTHFLYFHSTLNVEGQGHMVV